MAFGDRLSTRAPYVMLQRLDSDSDGQACMMMVICLWKHLLKGDLMLAYSLESSDGGL